jgi:amphi-Trp domain-containing protein
MRMSESSLLSNNAATIIMRHEAVASSMAEETKSKTELNRTDLAGRLNALSEEFSEEGEIVVEVENKSVTLHPPAQVNYEIVVSEREPMVGDNTETVTLELSWTPEE